MPWELSIFNKIQFYLGINLLYEEKCSCIPEKELTLMPFSVAEATNIKFYQRVLSLTW